jgi:VanZ family protein
VWGIFLLALTSWPSPPELPAVVSWIPNFDKLVHGLLYGVEGFLLYFAVAWPPRFRVKWRRVLVIAGALALFGTLDELHQLWIPGRSAEVRDAVMDTLGGMAGAAGALGVSRRRSAAEI